MDRTEFLERVIESIHNNRTHYVEYSVTRMTDKEAAGRLTDDIYSLLDSKYHLGEHAENITHEFIVAVCCVLDTLMGSKLIVELQEKVLDNLQGDNKNYAN